MLELIKYKKQNAKEQNEELHRNLADRIKHQAETAFAHRRTRDVTLHLRLIGPEIGKHQKRASHQAGPKCVTFMHIRRKTHRLKLMKSARNHRGIAESNSRRKFRDQQAKRRNHRRKDDRQLIFLCDSDRFAPTRNRIYDNKQTAADNCRADRPSEYSCQYNGWRINGQSRSQTPLQKKQRRSK